MTLSFLSVFSCVSIIIIIMVLHHLRGDLSLVSVLFSLSLPPLVVLGSRLTKGLECFLVSCALVPKPSFPCVYLTLRVSHTLRPSSLAGGTETHTDFPLGRKAANSTS
jgi:hypothetical protein